MYKFRYLLTRSSGENPQHSQCDLGWSLRLERPGGPEERLGGGLGAHPGARWETAAGRDHKIGFRSLAPKNSHL